MVMNYAVGLPTVGGFGDVHTLVDLAVAAEQHGWDGVHLWDHVLYHDSGWPVVSPVVAAAAFILLIGATLLFIVSQYSAKLAMKEQQNREQRN
jgi:alkanesulfonate monooxygenase SsuD/methylene tetrahydromethanopterin reductase-like flavin-dependent oxidoreductase (luciferase family)